MIVLTISSSLDHEGAPEAIAIFTSLETAATWFENRGHGDSARETRNIKEGTKLHYHHVGNVGQYESFELLTLEVDPK